MVENRKPTELPTKLAFDLEGTLVDLELLHQQAFEHVAATLGVQFGKEEFHKFVGAGDDAISAEISRLLEHKFDGPSIKGLKASIYHEMLHSQPIKPREGVNEYLDRAMAVSNELLVASLTPPANAAYILGSAGLSRFFYYVLSNDQVRFKKPRPDVYLMAARTFDVPNSRMLVHEDSPPGVEAAKAAGSPVVVFPAHKNLRFSQKPYLIFSLFF